MTRKACWECVGLPPLHSAVLSLAIKHSAVLSLAIKHMASPHAGDNNVCMFVYKMS